MLDEPAILPEDPEELRSFTARLVAEVKAQAILIEKLRHQLAGHRAHRFGTSSETAEQLQLALETSEIAAAAMIARMKLPDVEEKDRPKRRPIPDHIPRMEVELSPGTDAWVILPVLTGRDRRTHAAIFSFMAGVTPPMPMFGRSLL